MDAEPTGKGHRGSGCRSDGRGGHRSDVVPGLASFASLSRRRLKGGAPCVFGGSWFHLALTKQTNLCERSKKEEGGQFRKKKKGMAGEWGGRRKNAETDTGN